MAAGPPHLRAALAMIGGADMGATSWPGGTIELAFLALYSLGQTLDTISRLDVDDAAKADLRRRVAAAASDPAATVATLPLTGLDVLDHPELGRAWQQRLARGPVSTAWDRRHLSPARGARARVPEWRHRSSAALSGPPWLPSQP